MTSSSKSVFFAVCLMLLPCFGCASFFGLEDSSRSQHGGIEQGFESYIPAKTAVLPCQSWPEGSTFKALGQVELAGDDLKQLCQDFSKFIISGFKGQPYMNGYSDRAVVKKLRQAGKANLLARIFAEWSSPEKSCCEDLLKLYKDQVAQKEKWLIWLNHFTKATGADAILIPIVLNGRGERENRRGLHIARRELELALLLVNTSDGKLIWSGDRKAQASNKALGSGKSIFFPPWEDVKKKVLTDLLFKGFPGKINKS